MHWGTGIAAGLQPSEYARELGPWGSGVHWRPGITAELGQALCTGERVRPVSWSTRAGVRAAPLGVAATPVGPVTTVARRARLAAVRCLPLPPSRSW